MGLALTGSVATFVYANVAPPPAATTIDDKIFSDAVRKMRYLHGELDVKITDGSQITFYVPMKRSESSSEE